jgi:hypothetical protein
VQIGRDVAAILAPMVPIRAGAARLAPAVLAACSAAPIAPGPPPAAAPPPAAIAAPAPPVLLPSLVGEAAPPIPAPPAEPFAPLDREVVPFPLPAGTPPVYGLGGRDEHDVWILARKPDNAVVLLHWDGARVTRVPGPSCQGELWGVSLSADGVVLVGTYYEEGGAGTLTARREGRGWTCETSGQDQRTAIGKGTLRFHDQALTYGDERQPAPGGTFGDGSSQPHELAAGAADDLWIYTVGGGLVLHGNGLAWEPRPPGVARVHSLRVDPSGVAWMVGGDAGSPEGDVVARWDREAHAWTRLPAPDGLRGTRVRVGGAEDVWILGKEHVHRWDGHVFHRGPSPVEGPNAAWLSPTALWLAGARGSGEGVVVRLVEKKP